MSKPRAACGVVCRSIGPLLLASLGLGGQGCAKEPASETPSESAGTLARLPGLAEAERFRIWVVDATHAGQHIDLAVTVDGQPAVSYFASEGETRGTCDEISNAGGSPPRLVWPLYVARRQGEEFVRETVAEVLGPALPPGQAMAHDGSGQLAIATLTGGPLVSELTPLCSAHDLGLYQRSAAGEWAAALLVQSSGEAASGEPASDYGEVVGYWPALAFDPQGRAWVAYKDVHAGGVQGDDFRRADLELVQWQPGAGSQATGVDLGRGGGKYNQIAVDGQGRVVIAYYLEAESQADPQRGLWLARALKDASGFERVRLHAGGLTSGIALVIDEGRPRVLFQDPDLGVPVLVELTAEEDFSDADAWTADRLGDSYFVEGSDPSLVLDGSGRLWAAYYRCGESASWQAGSCDGGQDGLMVGMQEQDGSWSWTDVDSGENTGECGRESALAVAGESLFVAYRCQRLVDSRLVDEVRLAETSVP